MDIITSASKCIEGFFEAIVNDTVYGWVNVDPEWFSVCVILDGVITGTADGFLPRADLSTKPLARGFSIKCDKTVTSHDLVKGRLQVIARDRRSIVALPAWPPLRQAGSFLDIDLTGLKKAWDFISVTSRQNFSFELGLSHAGRAFGRISSDGVAQVGRNGYLFLVSGRNHPSKFYTDEIELDIGSWVKCFAHRQNALKSLNIRYLQVMIPEKSSVFYEYAPFTATAGSASYCNLTKRSYELDIPICDTLPDLLAAKEYHQIYPLGDTHLSTFGAEIVAKAILKALDESRDYTVPRAFNQLRVGDLIGRFAGDGDVQELVTMYETLYFDNIGSEADLVSSFDPDIGHFGRRRVWRNGSAPLKKKVICFGNSFFERGENSDNLSWWFSRLFSEFHFIWSPDLDINYVETIGPDIVICQTIERFLTEVPVS